jgi:hypothetical protein
MLLFAHRLLAIEMAYKDGDWGMARHTELLQPHDRKIPIFGFPGALPRDKEALGASSDRKKEVVCSSTVVDGVVKS